MLEAGVKLTAALLHAQSRCKTHSSSHNGACLHCPRERGADKEDWLLGHALHHFLERLTALLGLFNALGSQLIVLLDTVLLQIIARSNNEWPKMTSADLIDSFSDMWPCGPLSFFSKLARGRQLLMGHEGGLSRGYPFPVRNLEALLIQRNSWDKTETQA